MHSTMVDETTPLGGLPDELVLEILSYFLTIRSYETQSTDFRDPEKEKTRQSENRARKRSLCSVCLASRHMNRIATPILYASFAGAVTRNGLESLELFHQRTLASRIPVDTCIEYLQYVEVRLEDDQGNSLHDDTFELDVVYQAAHYLQLLADVIKCAPNLQHLSLVALETNDVSFWKHIITEEDTTGALTQTTVARQDFHKLRILCVQMHIDVSMNHCSGSFDQICSVMSRAPLLSDFRAHGVATFTLPPQPSELGTFNMLRRLEVTECMVEIAEVANILSACKELQHVVCTWSFLNNMTGTLRDLYVPLLRHKESLESLHLDLRQVDTDGDLDESQYLGTLLPFRRLKRLAISEHCLLGSSAPLNIVPDPDRQRETPLPSMDKLLPSSLKDFALLMIGEFEGMPCVSLDNSPDLWGWVTEYSSSGLHLERFSIDGEFNRMKAPDLTKAFLDMGVQFELSEVEYFGTDLEMSNRPRAERE